MYRGPCTSVYLRPMSYFFLFLTLSMLMVSLCTSSWYSVKQTGVTMHMGLWNVCKDKADVIGQCSFLPEWRDDIPVDNLTAIRALYSMAVMMLLGALGYPPFFKQMSSSVLKIEFMAVLATIGGVCSFIAMLVITHQVNSLDTKPIYGYSYVIGWVATGQSFLSAGLIYIASKDNVYVEGIY